jgi:hypothetical protein
MKRSFLVIPFVLAVAGCLRSEGSAPPSTSAAEAEAPPACLDAKLMFAESLGRLILAGCVDQSDPGSRERLWTWTGGGWEQLAADGPVAHVVSGFAWDEEREVLVRYGGIPLPEQECSAETWEWSPQGAWVELEAEPPPACDHARLAYDAAAGHVLLAGGGDADQRLVAGTWSWDGATWERVAADGPPPRAHFGFAYDEVHRQTLLLGGYDGSRVYDDLWTWDGSIWTRSELQGPTARSHFGLGLSPDGLLVFGGATGTSTFGTLTNETWYLTDGRWTLVAGAAPSPRGLPALGYDPERGVMILYGGFGPGGDALADTWEWDGAWSCISGCD